MIFAMTTPTSFTSAFRQALPMAISVETVEECVKTGELFDQVLRQGLDQLEPAARRGRLCVDIGVVAESVATLAMLNAGVEVFGELASEGVHGVDVLCLTPAGEVVALEVKGTLSPRGRPRLRRSRTPQMSLDWLTGAANPMMAEWDLEGADVYGGVIHINFSSMSWRIVLTEDYLQWVPVTDEGDLTNVAGLWA
jgi:hypothetical protein